MKMLLNLKHRDIANPKKAFKTELYHHSRYTHV